MKIYLIDPRKRTVEEVDYDDDHTTMYKLLGHNCEEFQAIILSVKRDILYVDANARTPMGEKNYHPGLDLWRHKRYHSPLTGRGLVIGCDSHGNSASPVCSVADVVTDIRWRQ